MLNYEEQLLIHGKIRNFVKNEINNISLESFISQMWPDICTVILEIIPKIIEKEFKLKKIYSERLNTLIAEPNQNFNFAISMLRLFFSKDKNYKPNWLINKNNAISFMTDSRISSYSSIQKLKFVSSRKNEWFSKFHIDKNTVQINNKISDFLNYVLTKSLELVNLKLDNNLTNSINFQFQLLFSWYLFQKKNIDKINVPKTFLSGTMGSPFNRLFADKVIENGGKIHVFDHGVGSGLWTSHADDLEQDLDRSNYYITYGSQMIEGVKLNDNPQLRINKNNKPNFLIHPYENIKFRPRDKIKNSFETDFILVTASASKNRIMPTVLYSDKILREFQLNLVKKITNFNKTISIKIHPETFDKNLINMLMDLNVPIIKNYFEKINWNNEVFIFENPQTSAFRDAVINDYPIIILNFPRLKILPNAIDYLKKRCVFINCDYVNNKIIFDAELISNSKDNAKELSKDKIFKKIYYGIDG